MIATDWQDVISQLGDPSNHFFTKEDSELVQSYISLRNFNFWEKIRDFLEDLPICKIYQILKIRKIGSQLMQDRQLRLEAINRSQEVYRDWLTAQVNGLAQISASFSNNPVVDVKQAAIAVILETQIVTQITRLGTQTTLLEKELERNPWCVDCCNGG